MIVDVKSVFFKGKNYWEFFIRDENGNLKHKKMKKKDYELFKELQKVLNDE